jgi:hypothetical protein
MTRSQSWLLFSFLIYVATGGCMHSHVIQVTVTNTSAEKISNIVIEYPEASFGINSLEPGKSFQYKIKPTTNGGLKIEFLNARGTDRAAKGPEVHKGDEGSINLKLTQEGVSSEVQLR